MSVTAQKIQSKLSDRRFRLDSLYCIIPEAPVNGKTIIPFKLRPAQHEVLDSWHHKLLINKSRKQGISTCIALIILDATIFNKNHCSVIIDHTEAGAFDKLQMIKTAWHQSMDVIEDPAIKQIWMGIKERVKIVSESKSQMVFSNGSSIIASTNSVGKSPHILYISEYGITSVESPEKALKIKRGAINSVARDAYLIIESTTRSSAGIWSDLLRLGLNTINNDEFDPMTYKIMFRGWTDHPTCTVQNASEENVDEFAKRYFEELEEKYKIPTTIGQRVWWCRKFREIGDDIYTEFPATFEESLRTSSVGAIYPQMMQLKINKRLRKIELEHAYPFYVASDIGVGDSTAMILFQICGRDILLHRFFVTNGEGADCVVRAVRKWERELKIDITKTFVPFDAARRDIGSGKPYTTFLENAGMSSKEYQILPRCESRWNGIRLARSSFNSIWIHEQCQDRFVGADGDSLPSLVESLENYKRAKNGEPDHCIFSHAADAFRYIFEAIDNNYVSASGLSSVKRFQPSRQNAKGVRISL